MIEVILNDRLGKKIRVKCNEDDTIGDLKKLVAAQTGKLVEIQQSIFRVTAFFNTASFIIYPNIGTRPEKIKIQKWYTVYKVIITCIE